MKLLKLLFLFIWQLPQNILGLIVILVTGAHHTALNWEWIAPKWPHFGVSLGNYVIFGGAGGDITSIKHEQGHQKQSQYLGPLYLILIGLPSILGNIATRIAWSFPSKDRRRLAGRLVKIYYSLPWEHWADKLGGVTRDYEE